MFCGKRVRLARIEAGMSVPTLAQKARITVDTIYRLERGGQVQPTTMAKIAAALGRNIKDFVDDDILKGE